MTHRGHVAALALGMLALAGCAAQGQRDVLYQTSTINALLEGLYDGDTTLAALAAHGDFGIGTFDALDGEMVLVGGTVYQVRADGTVCRPGPEATTPFAAVTFFDVDRTADFDGAFDLADLTALIDQAAPGGNVPLAVRITGTFKYVKTRSVPRQAKPYPRLAEVAKRQPTFEFRDAGGTIVGFRCPEYMKGLNVPGYHLHYLTADRSGGGHVLEIEMTAGRIEIDVTPALHVALPTSRTFGEARLGEDRSAELQGVER
jgi:acetolactate decarboxylase